MRLCIVWVELQRAVIRLHRSIDFGGLTTGKNLPKSAVYQRVVWLKRKRLLNSCVCFFDTVRVDKSQRRADVPTARAGSRVPRWIVWRNTIVGCLWIGRALGKLLDR